MEVKLNLMDLLAKTRKIIEFSIYNVPEDVTHSALQHIVELAVAGDVRPVVDSSFTLDQWDQAVTRLTSRKAIGKIVFTME
jgi:NADPH2:quinone reductase